MGVDAEMYVVCKREVSVEEVRGWAYRLVEAFGSDPFYLPDDRQDRHALMRVTDYMEDDWYDNDLPFPKERTIEVVLTGRYYGEGYERGNATQLIGIADWLERNLPVEAIYYGGDSGDTHESFDKARRDELWEHFCKVGHIPYVSFFANQEFNPPECPRCHKKPVQFGGGNHGLYGSFSCLGCNYAILTEDGGKTYQKDERKW